MAYLGRTPTPSPVTVDDIPDNSIDASKIIDGSIELAEISDGAITSTKLASAVTDAIDANSAKVTNSTSASDLASGTLPDARFPSTLPAVSGANLTGLVSDPTMGGDLSGTASNAQLVANAVGSTEIANGAVIDAKIGTMSSSKLTGSLPAISGASLTNLPAGGKVLQVVSVTKTSFFSTSSTSYVNVTGVTATITPSSASSKIYVTITGGGAADGTGLFGYGVVLRGATQIAIGASRGSAQRCSIDLHPRYSGAKDYATTISFSHLDSPATTSATTYKLQIKSTGGNIGVGGSYSTSDGNRSNLPTVITLTEIGA